MKKALTALLTAAISALMLFDVFACQATTKKGTRCRRSGEPYCWQHGGSSSTSASSSYSTSSSSSSTATMPKSYKVYEQRNSQGPRTFSKAMRDKKFREQNGYCAHCYKKHSDTSEMHGDHIVPYSKGGKTEYSNLQMLCPKCNLKKSNKYSY